MAPHFTIYALLLQVALVYCNETIEPQTSGDIQNEHHDSEPIGYPHDFHDGSPKNEYNVVEDSVTAPKDFYELFFGNHGSYSTGQSVQMMEEATKDSCLTPDEQVMLIKNTADKIAACIQEELVGILSFILSDNQCHESGNRNKRSTDSSVDYPKMVMRLLRHLKCSNENQNIAIEKMMTAQEIADKYGIDYQPEADALNEIFDATENKNQDIIALLNQFSKSDNEINDSVPVKDVSPVDVESIDPNYYHYNVDEDVYEVTVPPQHLYPAPHCHYSFQPHCETQIRPPPVHHHPVSQRPPAFYQPQHAMTPAPTHPHHHNYHHHEQEEEIPEFTAIFVEAIEPEPELTGEEFEETVSSKVTIDKGDQPETQTAKCNNKEEEEKEREEKQEQNQQKEKQLKEDQHKELKEEQQEEKQVKEKEQEEIQPKEDQHKEKQLKEEQQEEKEEERGEKQLNEEQQEEKQVKEKDQEENQLKEKQQEEK